MSELALKRLTSGTNTIKVTDFYGVWSWGCEGQNDDDALFIDCSQSTGSKNIKPYYSSSDVLKLTSEKAALLGDTWSSYPDICGTTGVMRASSNRNREWTGLSSSTEGVRAFVVLQGRNYTSGRNVYSLTSTLCALLDGDGDSVDFSTDVRFADISNGATIYNVGTGHLDITVTLKKNSSNVPYLKFDWTYSGPTSLSVGRNASRSAETIAAKILMAYQALIFCGTE